MTVAKTALAALLASFFASAAFAGDLADACTASMEAEGRDPSGCQCLEDEVVSDADLIAEFTALGEIADAAERYAAASPAAKAAMDKCTRAAE